MLDWPPCFGFKFLWSSSQVLRAFPSILMDHHAFVDTQPSHCKNLQQFLAIRLTFHVDPHCFISPSIYHSHDPSGRSIGVQKLGIQHGTPSPSPQVSRLVSLSCVAQILLQHCCVLFPLCMNPQRSLFMLA
nr:hypothetical protein Iba_chr14eCG9850 [Ipomoea batatas]